MKRRYSKEFLKNVNVAEVIEVVAALSKAFVWYDSPQGEKAWLNVIYALDEIVKAKEKE